MTPTASGEASNSAHSHSLTKWMGAQDGKGKSWAPTFQS